MIKLKRKPDIKSSLITKLSNVTLLSLNSYYSKNNIQALVNCENYELWYSTHTQVSHEHQHLNRPADDIAVALLNCRSLCMLRGYQLFLQCSHSLDSFLLKRLKTGIKCLLVTETDGSICTCWFSDVKPKFHYADFATKSGTSSWQSRGHKSWKSATHITSPTLLPTFPMHCNELNSIRATQTGLSRTCHELCCKHLDMLSWFVSATFVICVDDFHRNFMVSWFVTVFVRDFHDLCPRRSPRGSFGKSWCNGIWAQSAAQSQQPRFPEAVKITSNRNRNS